MRVTIGDLAIALAVAGCDRRPPITSCDQDLTGEYAAGEQRWMVTDRGGQLDVFPLFPDVPASVLEVAPRSIELARIGGTLRGHTRRRYMKGATSCIAKLPATIARCADDTLEVVHAETAPPLAFEPCQWGRTEPARVDHWQRR